MTWSLIHNGSVVLLRSSLRSKLNEATRHNPAAELTIEAVGALLENLMGNEAEDTILDVSVVGHRGVQETTTISLQVTRGA